LINEPIVAGMTPEALAAALGRVALLDWQVEALDDLALESLENLGAYEGLPPRIALMPDGRTAKLLAPLSYAGPDGTEWPVPMGAELDGASIPRAFWTLIGGPFEGKYRDASIVHDHYCVVKSRSWRRTHRMFFDAMLCSGVGQTKAKIMYYAVYRFGPRWSEPDEAALEGLAVTLIGPDRAGIESFVADAEAIALQALNLSEIEALADARQADGDDLNEAVGASVGQSALERAKRLVVTGGCGKADDLLAVATEAARLPAFVLRRFEAKKIRIIACQGSVTDFETSLRGVTPRGWDGTGRTWDQVPGAYFPDRKRVVIATIEANGKRVVPTRASRLHGSASLTAHESLHGYDYVGGHAALRDDRFVQARTADLPRLGLYEQQPGQAGLEETFTESGARFAAEPEALRADWPGLHAFWAGQLDLAPVEAPLALEGMVPELPRAAVGTAQVMPDGALLLDLRAEGEGGALGHAILHIAPDDPAHADLAGELRSDATLEGLAGPRGPVVFRPPSSDRTPTGG